MKKIEAYIRPEKLQDIKEIMDSHSLNGLSVTQVMGFGNQKGFTEIIRGSEVDYNFVSKVKLELVVCDEQVDEVVSSIIEKAQTGSVGDGKIFISTVDDAIRIRTKETGLDAIQ